MVAYMWGDIHIHDQIPLNSTNIELTVLYQRMWRPGYALHDCNRTLHLIGHDTLAYVSYIYSHEELTRYNIYNKHTGTNNKSLDILTQIMSVSIKHFILVLPRWIWWII